MSIKLDPVEQYFLDKTAEISYGLWNAILTINGIILTAFSLVIAFSGRFNLHLTIALISLCCLSMMLILSNYVSAKRHYLEIGKQFLNPYADLSAEEKKEKLDRSNKRHRKILFCEKSALFLLFFEMFLIIVIVFIAKLST